MSIQSNFCKKKHAISFHCFSTWFNTVNRNLPPFIYLNRPTMLDYDTFLLSKYTLLRWCNHFLLSMKSGSISNDKWRLLNNYDFNCCSTVWVQATVFIIFENSFLSHTKQLIWQDVSFKGHYNLFDFYNHLLNRLQSSIQKDNCHDFPDMQKLLKLIWFDLTNMGPYCLFCFYLWNQVSQSLVISIKATNICYKIPKKILSNSIRCLKQSNTKQTSYFSA